MSGKAFLTIQQIAGLLRVLEVTVGGWIYRWQLRAIEVDREFGVIGKSRQRS